MIKASPALATQLREQTGHGLIACAKALCLCRNDLALAKEFLHLHGQAICMWRNINNKCLLTSPANEFLRKPNLLEEADN